MGAIETRIFKNGNSAAVRLPAALGFTPGTLVRVERNGAGLTIVPSDHDQVANDEIRRMIADIEQIWAERGGAPERPAERDPFEAPERPGL